MSYYSQNDEEKYILEAVGANMGTFLDIGAFDGKTLSNTYRLVELGWGGVCVEPSPSVFCKLLELHSNNPNVTLINAAIGLQTELIEFYDSGGDAVSTTDTAHVSKWEAGSDIRYKKFMVKTVALGEIFAKFGLDFTFINLDVENMNLQLFNQIPLALLENLKCMCVEHDGNYEAIVGRMIKFGFKEVARNAENLIFSR